jgi:hypothetical protein
MLKFFFSLSTNNVSRTGDLELLFCKKKLLWMFAKYRKYLHDMSHLTKAIFFLTAKFITGTKGTRA